MSISCYRLYFSRTKNKDYRWIYTTDYLSESELEEIKSDYETLLYEYYRKNIKHLIIQKREKGFAIYRLVDTEIKDNCGIAIYAITGIFFPFNEKINNNLNLFITDWYFNLNTLYKEVLDEDVDIIHEDSYLLQRLYPIIEAPDDSKERTFRIIMDNYLLYNNLEKGIKVFDINSKYEIETISLCVSQEKVCKQKTRRFKFLKSK